MLSVFDGDRELTFTGACLGHSTSHRPGKERWIELSIFRTQAGKYVIAGLGKTDVPGEVERRWAHVCEEPEGVIEALHMYDRDGVKYLTRTAKDALTQAFTQDEELRQAFMITHID